MIGKVKNPQILKRYNMTTKDLPVEYYSNTNAWMTGTVFAEWLSKWNSCLLREKRKVLLLIDNAPCHIVPEDYSNIHIQFLPPNTTAKIQPLDQGIIRSLKQFYRKMLAHMYLDGIENNHDAKEIMKKKFNLKIACDMVTQCWAKVKFTTIQNCFRKAGFVSGVESAPDSDNEIDHNLWNELQQNLNIQIAFNDYATADDAVETSQHLTEEQIVQHVQAEQLNPQDDTQDNPEDDPDELDSLSEPTIQKSHEILSTASQIRAYLMQHKLPTVCIDELEKLVIDNRIRQNTCQKSIRDFLQI